MWAEAASEVCAGHSRDGAAELTNRTPNWRQLASVWGCQGEGRAVPLRARGHREHAQTSRSEAVAPTEWPRSQENHPRLRAQAQRSPPSGLRCARSADSPAGFRDATTTRAETHQNTAPGTELRELTPPRSPLCLPTNCCPQLQNSLNLRIIFKPPDRKEDGAPGRLSRLGSNSWFGSGHHLEVHGLQARIQLCADSVKPAWESLSSPLPLPQAHTCQHACSLSIKIRGAWASSR